MMSHTARQLITAAVLAEEFHERANQCRQAGYGQAAAAAWQSFEENQTAARNLAAEIITLATQGK